MKVGMIAQGLSRRNGGVSEAVRLACEAFLAQDDVSIALFCADDDDLRQDFKAFPPVELHVARAYGTRRYGLAPAMVRHLLHSDIDILHVHGIWTFHACAAWLWMRLTGKPVVVAPHGMLESWILKRSTALKRIVSRLYQNDLLRRAGGLQALTVKEADDIAAAAPGVRCTVVPNFVPLRHRADFQQAPSWWDDSFDGKRIFTFLGRIHEKKGVVQLLDAWERFCIEQPAAARDSKLVLCGWNDGIQGLEERIADLHARLGNVHFGGPQYGDAKWHSLAMSNLLILPSFSEGLPMAIIEAWSVGTPTIMSAQCNLPEGFAAGAALPVRPEVEDIVAVLTAAAQLDAAALEGMAARAAQLVASTFSSVAFRSSILDLYRMSAQSGRNGQPASSSPFSPPGDTLG